MRGSPVIVAMCRVGGKEMENMRTKWRAGVLVTGEQKRCAIGWAAAWQRRSDVAKDAPAAHGEGGELHG